jgi:hypothetical protein
MRGAIAVVAVTAGAVIAALVLGLSVSSLHVTGGNMLAPQAYTAILDPGESICQGPESVPAETGFAEISVSTYGRPGPPLEVTAGGTTRGSRGGGYRDGWLRIPLRGPAARSAEPQPVEQVCVRNRGGRRVAIAGKLEPPEVAPVVGGEPSGGRITLRWRAAEPATWWDAAGEVARRVARGKSDLGTWTPVVLLALLWTGAFALVLRSVRA